HDEWWAAFPKPIFNQIVNALSGQVRDTLKKECHADLSKTPAADILKHFEIGRTQLKRSLSEGRVVLRPSNMRSW
ncbi:MAG: hypothetical protein AB7E49_11795, partial [Campylobacterales bacterium]